MTTRLLPALALTGLLHLSSPALAQDAPNSAHPGPVHTSLGTIQPSDVEAYVDLVFSDRNKGAYRPRDGKIHKLAEPFNIVTVWPECERTAHDSILEFKERTGLAINYSYGNPNGLPLSLVVIGINSMDDLKQEKEWLHWLAESLLRSDAEIINKVNSSGRLSEVVDFFYYKNNKISIITGIVKNFNDDKSVCNKIFPALIYEYITNSKITSRAFHITDMDNLFVSALYDQSIQDEESEDSARSKIVAIMLNKLKG